MTLPTLDSTTGLPLYADMIVPGRPCFVRPSLPMFCHWSSISGVAQMTSTLPNVLWGFIFRWSSNVYFQRLSEKYKFQKTYRCLQIKSLSKISDPQSFGVLLIPSLLHKDRSWCCAWSPDCSFWHYQKRWIPSSSTLTPSIVISFSQTSWKN